MTPALVTSAESIQDVSSLGLTDFSSLLTEVCSTFNDSIANCEQLPTTAWFYEAYSGSLGTCIERFSCNARSDCQCTNSSQCLVGETSIPPDTTTTRQTATIWYNNQVLLVTKLLLAISSSFSHYIQHFHIPPIALNLFYNHYLKEYDPEYSISVINHPLPRSLTGLVSNFRFYICAHIFYCILFIPS